MKEEVLRTLLKCKEMGWITINENLNEEALAATFVEIMKDMSLKNFIDIFSPHW